VDVNVEIDGLVLDGTDDGAWQEQLANRLDPATAAAVARAVGEAVHAAAPRTAEVPTRGV
jgi:hypothetical protein